jgi:anti-sigma factor RsiW
MSIFHSKTQERDAILSALIDGELNAQEEKYVQNATEHDTRVHDTLNRYRAIRTVMHNARSALCAETDMDSTADRVRRHVDRTIRVRPMHPPWWRVSVSLPVPVLSAAAVVVLVLAGVLVMTVSRVDSTPESTPLAGLVGPGAPDRHINVQVNVDADHTEQLLQWLNEQGHAQQVTVQLPEQAHFQLRGDPVLVRRNADRAEDLRIVPMEDGQE